MVDRDEVTKAAGISVIVAVVLTVMKIIAGVITNSLGMISEAMHSGLDLMAAGITFIAVNRASKSPDTEHPYGHGKIENFAALAETILLWITSIWIVSEAWTRIVHEEWPEASLLGVAVMVISILVNWERSRLLYRIADEHGSQALEADALHFSTDMISSVVVLIGLGFVFFGFPIGDPISAIGVAIIIFIASLQLGKEAYAILIDATPEGIEDTVCTIVETIPGVLSCDRVRARTSGPCLFVDVVLSVKPMTSVDDAHSIANLIEERLTALAQNVDCVVHIEPKNREDSHPRGDQIFSKMLDIAKAHPQIDSVHNVRILHLDSGYHILADLEMQPQLTVKEAHDISEQYEEQVEKSIEHVTKITLHLEETETIEEASDITPEFEHIVQAVNEIVGDVASDCILLNTTVTKDFSGVTITIDCGVNGDLSLAEGHNQAEAIKSKVESGVQCSKVIVHMEPIEKREH